MATMKRKSRVIDEMTATFADLKKSGLVSKKQLIEFEEIGRARVGKD
jgi:hypothetical protein